MSKGGLPFRSVLSLVSVAQVALGSCTVLCLGWFLYLVTIIDVLSGDISLGCLLLGLGRGSFE